MCGITGFINSSQQYTMDAMYLIIKRMSDTLIHRGPDDGGTWLNAEVGIALGHRRLSILDLSPEGRQPMFSTSGRYVIVFNGEIYNFKALRRELEQQFVDISESFRGHSDTEVMLAAIEAWGLENAVKRFNGMFAFAVWDCKERLLHLVRDRMGEKPLYYGWMGNTFLFASELKALRAHPDFRSEVNRNALALYLRHNYVPAPYSIYKGIYKLPPGTILTINSLEISTFNPIPYWSVREVSEIGVTDAFHGTDEEAIRHLDRLLRDAISQQMVADVPLGAFLSGGIDSSTVVAIMQAHSNQPVKTFTIGFHETAYNEAENAKAVAKHLNTDHTELYVTPEQAIAVIPKLPTLYDEPFSDSSQIPTFLVAALARQQVTVCLSGDGGDELFCGYKRYFLSRSIWQKISWMPKNLRRIAASYLKGVSPETWNRLYSFCDPLIPDKNKVRFPGDKLHKLAEVLATDGLEALYHSLISHWKFPASLVLNASEPLTILTDKSQWAVLPEFIQRMMYLDMVTYLPDDILVKVDRASMGVSLESRVPLLDHRVVEFAWRIPMSMKIRNGQGKWLLRQVLYQYVPKDLIDRPKMGFGVPIDAWLCGPLREWAEGLLDERRIREEGYFNPTPIREKWNEHLSGKRNWQYYLWDILMFQAWLEQH